MEAVCTSETSGSIYQSTQCHKREVRSEWAYFCLGTFQGRRESSFALEAATRWLIECPLTLEPPCVFTRLKIPSWWSLMFSGMWRRVQWHYAEVWSRKLLWHVSIYVYLPIYAALVSQKTVFLKHVFNDVVWRYLKLWCINLIFLCLQVSRYLAIVETKARPKQQKNSRFSPLYRVLWNVWTVHEAVGKSFYVVPNLVISKAA